MEEEIIIPETRPQPKVALLSFSEYFGLNCKLSVAKGYNLDDLTARVFEMNPKAAKVNIQYDTDGNTLSYDSALVAYISSEIQINYPDLLTGVELIDKYIPVDTPVQEMVVGIMTSDVINWTLANYLRVGGSGESMKLVVNQQLYDSLLADAKTALSNLGISIQVK